MILAPYPNVRVTNSIGDIMLRPYPLYPLPAIEGALPNSRATLSSRNSIIGHGLRPAGVSQRFDLLSVFSVSLVNCSGWTQRSHKALTSVGLKS